ncbi:hypothetical protein AVEN_113343-1 [Araneus ventricosus]|uniref:Uncharacterized protein n=1 Tax=Araneus ventricosus TaxID=182803 RepID=A0A4Y2KK03_ARAVE|nr:hypothetical protein AVEN_113343-1 [Araneus ventricosus]
MVRPSGKVKIAISVVGVKYSASTPTNEMWQQATEQIGSKYISLCLTIVNDAEARDEVSGKASGSLVNALKAADAPINDLGVPEYIYEKYDTGVARAVLLTFSRDLWYLTGEEVIFSLFSKKVSDSEKKKISASLMKYKANEKITSYWFPCLKSDHKTASIDWIEVMIDF